MEPEINLKVQKDGWIASSQIPQWRLRLIGRLRTVTDTIENSKGVISL